MNYIQRTISSFLFILVSLSGFSQSNADTLLQQANLQGCVLYALKHFPQIQQAAIDEAITEQQIKSKLSQWYPQINLSANYQNYFQLQPAYFNGSIAKSGTYNSSLIGFSATQNLFDRDVLLATQSARDVRRQIHQTTTSDKIDLAVNVSKAFYDVLLTQKQIELVNEDILRLERSQKDTYNQYRGGLVDKTDYKRAIIALNNAHAQKKSQEELLKTKMAYLKLQMGYTADNSFALQYDSTNMEKEALLDTSLEVRYENRIEYQLILTQKKLLEENLRYFKWGFLPTVSAYGSYGLNYFSTQFSSLYSQNNPASFAGLQLSFPIFQGSKRIHDIHAAKLQLSRADLDLQSAKNNINAQFMQAIAGYKSNLNDYYVLRENVALAKEVFKTLELQYKSGIKTYLDVITAETDLRNAELNYINSLFQVLSSKIDVQRALGTISY